MTEALDIVQLRTFVAIEECGGFGRAAAALHLSQPTVSQHVRHLERHLGQPLVEKDGRRTRFTSAGERLLVEARRILAVHDAALERLDASPAPQLVIGSTETAAEQLLPELLQALRGSLPDRRLTFHIDRSTQMSELVLRGAIDLAIVLDTGNSLPGIDVGTLPLRWYARPDWQERTIVPLVAYSEPCGMRQRALTALETVARDVEIAAESTSLEGVLAAARAGLGVAVLPSAGVLPRGLVPIRGLPSLGEITVRIMSRKGVDRVVEATAVDALRRFFAPRLRAVGA